MSPAKFPRSARRTSRHDVRDLSRGRSEDGGAGGRGDRQHQLVRIPRRLRRNRLSSGQGRCQRVDAGHRCRVEGTRGAGECGLSRREDAVVDRAGVRGPHRRVEPKGPARRGEYQAALDAPPPEFVAPTYAYLASDLAKDVTGQIFVAAGGFVGRFDRPTPTIIAYRDHPDSPPWSVAELHGASGWAVTRVGKLWRS